MAVLTRQLKIMSHNLLRFVQGAMVALLCSNVSVIAKQTADFRIETDVMEAGKAKPIDQTVTLFSGGSAFDYSRATPNQILVVDAINNRIALLDSQRQMQTRINLQELRNGIESAKNKLLQAEGGPEKIEDAAQTSFDPTTGLISIGKRFIRYDAKLQQPASPEFAVQYATFANASALMNAWQSRGSAPPPFARLQLNQAISERESIPSEIKRTVFAGGREVVMVSRIHPTYSLSAAEKKQIEQYNTMLLSFPSVSLANFNGPANAQNR